MTRLSRSAARAARRLLRTHQDERHRPSDLTTGDHETPGMRRARVLEQSGVFDVSFYSACVGRTFESDLDAAMHAVTFGMPQGLSFNPFVDCATVPAPIRRAWRAGRFPRVLDFLRRPDHDRPLGPLLDPRALPAGLTAADWLAQGQAHPGTPAALPWPPSWRGPRPDVGTVRRSLEATARAVVDPHPTARTAADVDWGTLARGRAVGRTTVVIPTYDDWFMTERAVHAVLETTEHLDVEVVVVDNGSTLPCALRLAATLGWRDRVRLLRLPANANFAGGSNAGLGCATGDRVVFLNNDTRVRHGWLPPLLAALDDPEVAGAQSLLVYDDETIQSAGTVFLDPDLLPTHLLVGHPKEDARSLAGRRFRAVTAAALAMRWDDAVALRGFDTAFVNGFEDVDLCLRAAAYRPGGFRVVPDSVVTHYESRTAGRFDRAMENRRLFLDRWAGHLPEPETGVYAELGWHLARVDSDGRAVPAARPVVTGRLSTRPGRLRWGILLPSTGGHWGDDWGDTHFGQKLAAALTSMGHDAVLHRRGAHQTPVARLDDVSLAIRGAHRTEAPDGATAVLWVISHPDDVSREEVASFDLAFAAADGWGPPGGGPLPPLLQATDFAQPPLPTGRAAAAVFVGSGEGRRRPMVEWAVTAGIPLAVHGPGWEHLPPGVWASERVQPDRLQDLYHRHAVVLADHWPDMARSGFVSNRVFDAVASGAVVLSDAVAGVSELFAGRVVACDSAQDVADAFAAATSPTSRPVDVSGLDLSFASRAERLVEVVLAHRAKTYSGTGVHP